MKKRVLIIVIAVAAVIAGGALFFVLKNKDHAVKDSVSDEHVVIGLFRTTTFSDSGMLTIDEEQRLQFIDGVSHQKTFVCDKINCEHKASNSSYKSDCNADVGEVCSVTEFLYEDYIYLVGSTDKNGDANLDSKYLYRELKNGTNREIVASFPNVQTIGTISVGDDYLLMSYENEFDYSDAVNPVKLEECINGMVIVNLNTYDNKVLELPEISSIVTVSVSGNKSYADCNDVSGKKGIYCLDNEEGSFNRIIEVDESCSISFGDEYACCYSEKGYGYYNLSTGEFTEGGSDKTSYMYTDDEYMYMFNGRGGYMELNYFSIKDNIVHKSGEGLYYGLGLAGDRLYYTTQKENNEFINGYILSEDFRAGEWDKCYEYIVSEE